MKKDQIYEKRPNTDFFLFKGDYYSKVHIYYTGINKFINPK